MRQCRGDGTQLGLGGCQLDTFLHSRDHVVIHCPAGSLVIGREADRRIDSDLHRREPELWRKNADDDVGLAVERERPAEHRPVRAEAAAPQRIAEQGYVVPAFVFFGSEPAAQLRLHGEHPADRRRRPHSGNILGLAPARQCEAGLSIGGDRLERFGAHRDVEIVGRREDIRLAVRCGIAGPQRQHSFGVGIRQRSQQDPVDQAENRGVRRNAQREREGGGQRETGSPGEYAKSVDQVLAESVHGREAIKQAKGRPN